MDPNQDPNVIGDDPGVDPNAAPAVPPAGADPKDPTGGDATPGTEIPATPDPDKKGGVQKKIDKLTKRASKAEAQAEYWKGVAEGRAQQTPEPEPKPAAKSGLNRDDFDTDEEYIDAVVAKQAADRVAAEAARSKREKINAQYVAARGKYEDFDDVALADDLPIPLPVWEAMQGDLMPDILYHLGSNPSEARRLAGLPPSQAAKGVWLIEQKLKADAAAAQPNPNPNPNPKAQPTPAKPPPSKAPEPTPTVKAKPTASPSEPTTRKDRFDKWDREREDDIRAKFTGGK